MKKLIEKIIQEYDLPLIKHYHDENCDFESTVIDAFMDFGKQVCELQKQECDEYVDANFGSILKRSKSLLNCKNVCTT